MPDTITFEADGEQHEAVVGLPVDAARSDSMVREVEGVRYTISISLGSVPGYPGVFFVARPVVSE